MINLKFLLLILDEIYIRQTYTLQRLNDDWEDCIQQTCEEKYERFNKVTPLVG